MDKTDVFYITSFFTGEKRKMHLKMMVTDLLMTALVTIRLARKRKKGIVFLIRNGKRMKLGGKELKMQRKLLLRWTLIPYYYSPK